MGQCLVTYTQWYYLVNKYQPEGCVHNIWSTSDSAILQQICVFIAKSFFILRIRKLAKHNAILFLFVPAIIGLASFALHLKPVYQNPLLTIYDPTTPLYWRVTILLTISTDCALLTDLAVTLSMCILLHQYKTQNSMMASRSMMNRLFIYTLATGLSAILFETLFIACWFAFPGTFIFDGVFHVMGRVDVICILAAHVHSLP
ncbi:hypothetical protein NEOLEDRAFT_1131819 [Neolentinus lepideus HHB14362 ss-1]|uniref:DUF6534 domain-containing protein n=1 Tax=Neolentinus lepideus HHB14362 ss-1 TaxID=1314782 RepID=A0A165TK13_9AGAM|nr:hypothetical protein NEOLEDRAFT_1131819 [Neolentinus lepideus HHB14362 ss-1]